MFSITIPSNTQRKRSVFHLSPRCGTLPLEMFAQKSMDVNSNLLKLKLDMVFYDLPMEEAQSRFQELTATIKPPEPPKEPAVIVRKKIKTLERKV